MSNFNIENAAKLENNWNTCYTTTVYRPLIFANIKYFTPFLKIQFSQFLISMFCIIDNYILVLKCHGCERLFHNFVNSQIICTISYNRVFIYLRIIFPFRNLKTFFMFWDDSWIHFLLYITVLVYHNIVYLKIFIENIWNFGKY